MNLMLSAFIMDKPIVVIVVAIIILIVLAQSLFFLVKSIQQAKKIQMPKKLIMNTIKSSALFTIAPAFAILIGVAILISSLGGYALPWLRLSVIGALTYELPAASIVIENFDPKIISDGAQYVTVALIMTIGIIIGLVLIPFLCKPISGQIDKMKVKNSEWTEILISSLFIGMVSAFLGFVFSDVLSGPAGWVPVIIMMISAIVMASIGLIIKVTKWKFLEDYAIPLSMVIAMLCVIPVNNWLIGA